MVSTHLTTLFSRALPLIVVLTILAPLTGWCQLDQAVRHFERGNEQYREGNYTEALASYREALNSRYESAALYFNMGNAYYRLDELGQAIRYYERARRLLPNDERVLHNLSQARSRVVDTFPEQASPRWMRWWNTAVTQVGALGFFGAGLLFYLLSVGLLSYRLLTTASSWIRSALGVSSAAGALLLAAAFVVSVNETASRRAVVTAEEVPLHRQARSAATSERTLHEGILLEVLRADSGWVYVRLPNGTTGWLTTDAVADI